MEIEKYIIALLHEKDCVVIPGLGGFVSEHNSADIHPVSHRFTPPSKKLAFNELLQSGDSLLIDIISSAERVSRKDAAEQLENYVAGVKAQLQASNYYEIKEVGRLILSTTGKLEFEAFTSQNFLDDSFGLSDLIFKPIERNTMKPRPAKKSAEKENANAEGSSSATQKKKSSGLGYVLIPFFVLLTGAAYVYEHKEDKAMQAYFPFTLLHNNPMSAFNHEPQRDTIVIEEAVTETPAEEATAEVQDAAGNAGSDATAWAQPENNNQPEENASYERKAISMNQGAYSIIVGSFTKKRNAEKLIRKIEKKGGNALLIEAEPELYRVSVAEFNEKQVAFEELEKIRSEYGSEAWVKAN